jgi:hypothetical protein
LKRWYLGHGQFLPITFCVLPQLAISEHFTDNLHKSLIVALSFNFARHSQLRKHAVTSWRSVLCVCKPLSLLSLTVFVGLVCISGILIFFEGEGKIF